MVTEKINQALSKPEIQFWMPVIISSISITMTFALLMARISVLETKMDNMISLIQKHEESQITNENKIDNKFTNVINNLNDLNARTVALETLVTR